MMTSEHAKRRLVDWILAEINRQAGRRYLIDSEALDLKSLRELQRLLCALDDEKCIASPAGSDDALAHSVAT